MSEQIRRAELKFTAALAEHNISFRAMDHLSELFGDVFHDSEIAKGFACKRTKAANLVYDVMAPSFEKNLVSDIKDTNKLLGKTLFSLIIDESTDISTEKLLAVVVKYYSFNDNTLKTKFLSSVKLSGESAEDIFSALCKHLTNLNLDIKNILGFAADTTNVIFGKNNSVVSKIKSINPHCIFVKCVCHSSALAVSYACRTLPRSLDQIVKETYSYFSHSSKRKREFKVFQEFVGTENHNILRHYEIRWLSLHNCVSRIVEQWDALKLYFQQESLIERNHSAHFLHESFDNSYIKLYFLFLDYILPIVNKLNIIFQGNECAVHNIFRNSSEMLKSILSCYMKNCYISSTSVENIEPNSTVNFLDLKEMYLGIQVTKQISLLRQQSTKPNVTVSAIMDFLKRCQSFLVELCTQLKVRLPFSQGILNLRFIDPQVAVYEPFASLSNVLDMFPNVLENDAIKQSIDEEYRQMKYDKDVQNLMCSDGSNSSCANVEQFWNKVNNLTDSGNITKYKHLTNFVKCLMCIPISNAQCERIFSQVNIIKTKYRNRFLPNHISCLLHVKQSLSDGCTSFEPSKEMLQCNKLSCNEYNTDSE